MIDNIIKSILQLIIKLFNNSAVRASLKKLLWDLLYAIALIAIKRLQKLRKAAV